MLKLALQAKIPLVGVQTDDVINVGKALSEVARQQVQIAASSPLYPASVKGMGIAKGQLYYTMWTDTIDLLDLYHRYSKEGATLVVVNSEEICSHVFDAGYLTPPPSLISRFVREHCDGSEQATAIIAALAGLNYEQAYQVSKLAMTKAGVYTAEAVTDVRRTFFGSVRGLQMLSTEFLYYSPNLPLSNWIASNRRFLVDVDEPLLRPRGLLFSGDAGTGKSLGAKYLAAELSKPLYLLDIAALMEKYVGESEANLRKALSQAEQSAPCVLLIDEVEKLFTSGGGDESGVTTRLLSSLLWWMQEHKANILTVMTTNNQQLIPPELYRAGRIDQELVFPLLKGEDATVFAERFHWAVGEHLGREVPAPDYLLSYAGLVRSHAAVTKDVLDVYRRSY